MNRLTDRERLIGAAVATGQELTQDFCRSAIVGLLAEIDRLRALQAAEGCGSPSNHTLEKEDGKLSVTRWMIPYSDGSGYQATAKIEDRDDGEGAMLSIEMVYRVPLTAWPEIRRAIDEMVEYATSQAASAAAPTHPHTIKE